MELTTKNADLNEEVASDYRYFESLTSRIKENDKMIVLTATSNTGIISEDEKTEIMSNAYSSTSSGICSIKWAINRIITALSSYIEELEGKVEFHEGEAELAAEREKQEGGNQ